MSAQQLKMLRTAPIGQLFFKFTIPAVFSMLLFGIQGVVDGLFLGRYAGASELAAINLAQPYVQVVFGLTLLLSIGGISLAGRQLGASQTEEAVDTLQSVFVSITVIMAAVFVIGLAFSWPLARLMGANEALVESTAAYILIISLFALPISYMVHFGYLQRMMNRPYIFLLSALAGLIINVVLNYYLIARLGWGIRGAAVATGLAYCLSLLIVGPSFLIGKSSLWKIGRGRFSKEILPQIVANGSSEAVTSASAAISAFIFNLIFMRELGANGVTAFSVISYLSQIALLLMFGVADGVNPLISYNSGYGAEMRVKAVVRLGVRSNLIIGVGIFLMLYFGARPLAKLFIHSRPELLKLTVKGAKIYAFAFLFSGYSLLYSSYFTAIGASLSSALVSLGRGLFFIIPGIYLLPWLIGPSGIWWSVTFAEVATIVLIFVLLKRHKKRFVKGKTEEEREMFGVSREIKSVKA